MAGILKILQAEKTGVAAGIVISSGGNNNYVVRVKGRDIKVRSTLPKKLVAGAKVILTNASEETYIIGDDNVRKKGQVTIPVTG